MGYKKWSGLLALGMGTLLLSCQPEPKKEVETAPVKKVQIAEIEAGIKDFIAAKTGASFRSRTKIMTSI
jgi:hypothetical protein